MNFYLSAVDDLLKTTEDQPSIGVAHPRLFVAGQLPLDLKNFDFILDLLRGGSSRGQKGPFLSTLCLFSVI
jgi:hypothetical protein